MQAMAIGLDILRRACFNFTGRMSRGRPRRRPEAARAKGDGELSSRSIRPASWCSRPAARRITGAERSAPWGTRSGCLPATYVKPFVKRNKTDARDAAAITWRRGGPDIRPVPVKSEEQQASRALERSRELLTKQRTQLMNSLWAMLAGFGVVAAQGYRGFAELRSPSGEPGERASAGDAGRGAAAFLSKQFDALTPAIEKLEDRIRQVAKADPEMRRLSASPGVGFITAHAIVAAIGDGRQFARGRDFAAWAGMTPRQHSSAGKRRARRA